LLVLRGAYGLLARLPRARALAAGARLGESLYSVAWRPRRVALRNLAIAFPDKDDSERTEILRRSLRNLGRMVAEVCHLDELTADSVRRYVRIPDWDAWQRAVESTRERGAVILTGHVGNWELLAYAHGLLGAPVTLVHRPIRNAAIDEFIVRLRARAGTRSIGKHAAAKAALRALRNREMVAIPADQNQSRRSGVFVSFFGLPASTTAGPARLAMMTGAPIIPVFLLREGETEIHRLEVQSPIELAGGADRDADVVENTQRCTSVIEDVVRRHPDQWVWFHKRWRTRPLGEAESYSRVAG
jgi:KDO2-lipid IV(A) lauroyltransferase